MLTGLAAGAFTAFVIVKLRKIDSQTDGTPKHHWSMGIYMNDIPQTKQNLFHLGSIPLKIYESDECSDHPVPRKGEEINGVYYSGEYSFLLSGIVNEVSYDINRNWIVVECKCTDICRLSNSLI